MTRLPAALLAVSALAACATSHSLAGSQHAQRTAENNATSGETQDAQSLSRHRTRAQRAEAPRIDRHARAAIERQDMLTQMAFWASEYQNFPNDLEAAQKFSEALRKGGRADRAVEVAGESLQHFPNDPGLLTTYGLASIASHHPHDALRPLALVAEADAHNYRARSALGVALDQLGRYQEARQAYQEALTLHPNDPAILTNMGVSHLLAGEPADAEPILRQACALPNAPAEARQNLAVALALQGKFAEAEQLERIDLPPDQAAANMTYLRSLLSDPHRWGDMRHS